YWHTCRQRALGLEVALVPRLHRSQIWTVTLSLDLYSYMRLSTSRSRLLTSDKYDRATVYSSTCCLPPYSFYFIMWSKRTPEQRRKTSVAGFDDSLAVANKLASKSHFDGPAPGQGRRAEGGVAYFWRGWRSSRQAT